MPLDGPGAFDRSAARRAPWYRKRRTYRAAFVTPEGAEVLADLARFCQADRVSFDPRNPDAMTTAFNEGKRTVWLHLQTTLNLSHADIARLAQEEGDDGQGDQGAG